MKNDVVTYSYSKVIKHFNSHPLPHHLPHSVNQLTHSSMT